MSYDLEKIPKEVIALSDLKYKPESNDNNHNPMNNFWILNNFNTDKPIQASEEEIQNSKKYYKIDNKKTKELESTFKHPNLKINFEHKTDFFKNGNLYTYDFSNDTFKIYDEKCLSHEFKIELHESKIEFLPSIKELIQLDNYDIILLTERVLYNNNFIENEYQYQFLVYRLKENKYSLFQKLKENINGYIRQWYSTGGRKRSAFYFLPYKVKTIKEISGNKFFCLSNHGFKIYSLNSLNEYDLISINQFEINIDDYINNIEESNIFEIYENIFIFSLKINYGYHDSFSNSSLVLNLIELKN